MLPPAPPTITLLPWEVPQLVEITIVAQTPPPPAGQFELPPVRRPKRLPTETGPSPAPGQPGGTPGAGPAGAGPADDRIAIPVPIPVPKVEC